MLDYFGLTESDSEHVEKVCNNLANYFGEVYSEKYYNLAAAGRDVSIQLTAATHTTTVTFMKQVEERLLDNLVFIPWIRPIKWNKIFTTDLEEEGRTANLEMTVYAGLAATEAQEYSPSYLGQQQKPGVEMWGNGRKFTLKGRITDESVGWGYTYGGRGGTNPRSNASYRRLTIVALFSADDSRDIPWAAPVKNDYNRRSDFYAEIQITLAAAIRLFKDVHALLEFALIPFSKEWTRLDNAVKLKVLFRDVNASDGFINNFAQSKFGLKLLSFVPTLAFKDISNSEPTPTVHTLYRLESTKIRDIVTAAAFTKSSQEQRVAFLKALFPVLAKQTELEDKMGLSSNEAFIDE